MTVRHTEGMKETLTTASALLALLPRATHYRMVTQSMHLGSGQVGIMTEPNNGAARNALDAVFLTLTSPNGMHFRLLPLYATHTADTYAETLTIVARAAHPGVLCDRADIKSNDPEFHIELTLA
jgi:hypothetical protein